MQEHEAHGSSAAKGSTAGRSQFMALLSMIRDDGFAMSFQSVRQYREALLKWTCTPGQALECEHCSGTGARRVNLTTLICRGCKGMGYFNTFEEKTARFEQIDRMRLRALAQAMTRDHVADLGKMVSPGLQREHSRAIEALKQIAAADSRIDSNASSWDDWVTAGEYASRVAEIARMALAEMEAQQ